MNKNLQDIPDNKISEFAIQFSNHLNCSQKPEKPFVLYFIGMIGSGKSTTAKFLSRHYNLIRISTDEIRDFLEQNGFSRERSFDIAEIVAENFLQQGFGVCFDACFVDQYFQDHVVELSNKFKMQPILLQMQTPESIILKRLQSDNSDRAYKGDIAIQDYMSRKAKFENLTAQPVVIVDGSGNFDIEMKRVIDIIDKKLKMID